MLRPGDGEIQRRRHHESMERTLELTREDGQTMAEYSIVLAVITPLIVAVLALLSSTVAERLQTIAGYLS
jgi:Flp pilus assembly pilin Flp